MFKDLIHFQLPEKWSEFIPSPSRTCMKNTPGCEALNFHQFGLPLNWSLDVWTSGFAPLSCLLSLPTSPNHHKKEKRGRKKRGFSLWESWLCFDTQAEVEMKHWHWSRCCSTRCDAPGHQLLLLLLLRSCKSCRSCGTRPVACKTLCFFGQFNKKKHARQSRSLTGGSECNWLVGWFIQL